MSSARFFRKSTGFSFSFPPENVYSFDLEGRPIWIWLDGVGYQRGLSGEVLAKTRQAHGQKLRWRLNAVERQALWQRVYADLDKYVSSYTDQEILQVLQRYHPERLEAEREAFQAVYRPVSILPPDQYTAIVIQAAEGCSWNRCSFCNFYKDRPFRIKDLPEFQAHLAAVQALLGAGARTRPTLFLADGDALMIPQPRLKAMVEQMCHVFPGRFWYSFMDAFRPQAKTLEDYQVLAQLGLKRVYLGLETGHAPLLQLLNKPGSPELMRSEVLRCKQAGLQVGLIFMVGIGGEQMAATHLRDTLALLADLPLDAGDLIYLSEFVEHADQPYAQWARAAGLTPLSPEGLQQQMQAFRQGLKGSKARVAAYHLLEYLY